MPLTLLVSWLVICDLTFTDFLSLWVGDELVHDFFFSVFKLMNSLILKTGYFRSDIQFGCKPVVIGTNERLQRNETL